MASALFTRLHDKACQREHALISQIRDLWISLEMTDLQAAIRLAQGLQEAHEDFLDGLEPVAKRMGVDLRSTGCPHCGDPSCPGASAGHGGLVINLGGMVAQMMNLLMGKEPPQPPEDKQE